MTDDVKGYRGEAMQALSDWLDTQADAITGVYPRRVRESWSKQAIAARDWMACGGTAALGESMAVLGTIAQVRNKPISQIVPKILEKDAQFRLVEAVMAAAFSEGANGIAASKTVEEVDAAVARAQSIFTMNAT